MCYYIKERVSLFTKNSNSCSVTIFRIKDSHMQLVTNEISVIFGSRLFSLQHNYNHYQIIKQK